MIYTQDTAEINHFYLGLIIILIIRSTGSLENLDAIVEGSKVVHNNKMSTKLEKAEAEAKKNNSNDYLNSLKKKYNK